ncbi:hypothetical protein DVH02_02520 [Streptomyces corynorhini]|uniref:Secreted protein n=1 Tax=Streptomyces corynorhini TaxID=2282652 RepID=A0A370BD61_9ACTN|nr:hypothetical protein DVH02_02520 [Streptomyces corynorhini]
MAFGVALLATVSGLATAVDRSDRADRDRTPVASPAASRAASHSTCLTTLAGSHVTALCHNPYPETDLVQLHVRCARWWDVAADGARVEVGAAHRVRLADRCWKEVREAWVTHERP